MRDKTVAIQDYIFKNGKLSSECMVITTVETKNFGYLTAIENIPVETFRGGAYYKEILKRHKNMSEAKKEHEKIVKGTKEASKKSGVDKQ